ncbi:uncharacterized protein LOC121397139 [Xenopus laevis]|uniref:Uncharacterized protein LOC121397139 n=1 Tax=Xenopus laevis TaxID=8355 RepID=A0A8J1LI75_XENLA|nr:uncharacterized protein LOC121397139 [Xenopus laevis]
MFIFSRGKTASVRYLACAKCRKKLPSGQKEPSCSKCKTAEPEKELPGSAPIQTEQIPQTPTVTVTDVSNPIQTVIPDWAAQLATGIPKLASSLDKILSRLDKPRHRGSKRRAPSSSDEESDNCSRDSSPVPDREETLDLSEGELSCSSDMLDEEPSKFSAKAIDDLITSVLETLNIQEPETSTDKSKILFKRSSRSAPTFPSHAQLEQIIQQEWNKPESRFQPNRRFLKLYPFSADTTEKWSSPPSVDAPVSRLSKNTALPVPDASSFKDSGTALRPILATAWVSRAVQTWSESLVQAILSGVPRQELSQVATQIKDANEYICEAALDATQAVSRASALSIATFDLICHPKSLLHHCHLRENSCSAQIWTRSLVKQQEERARYFLNQKPVLPFGEGGFFALHKTRALDTLHHGIQPPTEDASRVSPESPGRLANPLPERRTSPPPHDGRPPAHGTPMGGRLLHFSRNHIKFLDTGGGNSRLSPRIRFVAPSPIFHVKNPKRTNKVQGLPKRAVYSFTSRGHFLGSSKGALQGILFQSVCRSQKRRIGTSSTRSKGTKQICSSKKVQNGISTRHHCSNDPRPIHDVPRHKGRLPACANLPFSSKVLTIRHTKPPLPIQGTSFWPHFGTKGVHKNHGSSHCRDTAVRNIHNPVSRRPVNQSTLFSRSTKSNPSCYEQTTRSRMVYQSRKIIHNTQTVYGFSRTTVRHTDTKIVPNSGKDCSSQSSNTFLTGKNKPFNQILHESSGGHGINNRSGSIRPNSHAGTSMEHSYIMEKKTLDSRDPSFSQDASIPDLVATNTVQFQGKTSRRVTMETNDNRCEPVGLGSSTRGQIRTRSVDSSGEPFTHKSSGDQGYLSRTQSLANRTIRPTDKDTVRQFDSGGLYKPPGGHKKQGGLTRSQAHFPVGGTEQRQTIGHFHPRPAKLGSRLPQPPNIRPRRMGAKGGDFSRNKRKMGLAGSRPNGFSPQPTGTNLPCSVPGPSGISSRRSHSPVGFSTILRISSNSPF